MNYKFVVVQVIEFAYRVVFTFNIQMTLSVMSRRQGLYYQQHIKRATYVGIRT